MTRRDGEHPNVDEPPLSVEEIVQVPPGAIAYNLIYTPSPTKFLQQAQQVGAITIDGLEMLVQQDAAPIFRHITLILCAGFGKNKSRSG